MLDSIILDQAHPYRPRISGFTRTFWDSLSQGRFVTTRSLSTQRLTFPPKPISPDDWSAEMEWVELSGRGTLYTHTVIYAAPTVFVGDLPYRVCIVDLDEGLRLATRFIGDTPPVIGMRVELVVVRYTDALAYAARAG